jgi:hypothetical protein
VIDIKRVLKYCKNLNIQFEDFLFLYTLRVRNENRKDEDFENYVNTIREKGPAFVEDFIRDANKQKK